MFIRSQKSLLFCTVFLFKASWGHLSFWKVCYVVDKIAFILLEPRCVQFYLRGASVLLLFNNRNDRYISSATWDLFRCIKKTVVSSGQPVIPRRPPLKVSNEGQPEGDRFDKKNRGLVKVEEEDVLVVAWV